MELSTGKYQGNRNARWRNASASPLGTQGGAGRGKGGGADGCGTTLNCDANGDPYMARLSASEYSAIKAEGLENRRALSESLNSALASNNVGRAEFQNWYNAARQNGFSGSRAEFRGALISLRNAVDDPNTTLQFHDSRSWNRLKATQTGQDVGVNDRWAAVAITHAAPGEAGLVGVHIRMDDTRINSPNVNEYRNIILHEYAHMAGMSTGHLGEPRWNWIPGNVTNNQAFEYENFGYPF